MGLTRPTHVPSTFDYWDNDATRWPELFRGKRPSQRKEYLSSVAIENGTGTELLRFYADIISHTDFDVAKAVQNTTEFKYGGAINVALNQDRKLGLIWSYRPVVPRAKIDDYRVAWKRFAHVPSKEPRPDLVEAFLAEVVPMLGDWSLEFARGYGDVTKTAVQNAENEAEEELQVRCVERFELALIGEDMAQNPALNCYCFARMDVRAKPKVGRDLWEKIAQRAEWLTLSELAQAFQDGHVLDPYTLTALQALQFTRPDLYAQIAT